ncbi:hypothetical protein [Aquimarina sp. I32.4]|uniref:hypothetical protein n=1 Tax=Aquimarina sp. I32.4 TaxID=2053903 RepID=UPI000CDEE0D3|nr:hypothetical protein [Aquimarina sp. I32.4]
MKNTFTFLLILLLCASCNSTDSLDLKNEENIETLEAIIAENLNSDKDVYSLNFSAEKLTGELEDISYDYLLKGSYFSETYDISSKVLSDPSKKNKFAYKNKKTFKIKDAPISIIATKYQEALKILEEQGLLEEDKDYHLDYWVFRTDKKGMIYADFDLNYYMNTTTSGRMRRTNYGQYQFIMNPDKSLNLKN